MCAGILEALNTSLQLTYHRRFVCFENGSACFQDTLRSILELYAKQVFSTELNKIGSEEAVEASKFLLNIIELLSYFNRQAICTVPAGLISVQTFPVHTMRLLWNMYTHVTIVEYGQHIPIL